MKSEFTAIPVMVFLSSIATYGILGIILTVAMWAAFFLSLRVAQ